MKRMICISLIVVAAMAVWTQALAEPPAVPATPAAVDDILYARSFSLEKGYSFEWSKEKPLLTEGTILVLKVDPDLVYARQVLEPVLYVGNTTAERINIGYRSGHVIAVVPANIDLTTTPVWFGTPELPERVDDKTVLGELALARGAGIKPFTANQVETALARGGDRITVADRDALRPYFVTLLNQYSSAEKDLIDTLNVPVTK